MKDRIQIDGTWYVKELNTTQSTEDFEFAPILLTKTALIETDTSCFEYRVPVKVDGEIERDYGYLVYTDKRVPRKEWTEDHWDNVEWLKNLRDDVEILDDISKISHEDIRQVRHLLVNVTLMGLMKD